MVCVRDLITSQEGECVGSSPAGLPNISSASLEAKRRWVTSPLFDSGTKKSQNLWFLRGQMAEGAMASVVSA